MTRLWPNMVGHDDFQDSDEIDIDWGVVVFEDFHDSWSYVDFV